jgi:hypothetical protein
MLFLLCLKHYSRVIPIHKNIDTYTTTYIAQWLFVSAPSFVSFVNYNNAV